jgi:hypothetical protein
MAASGTDEQWAGLVMEFSEGRSRAALPSVSLSATGSPQPVPAALGLSKISLCISKISIDLSRYCSVFGPPSF